MQTGPKPKPVELKVIEGNRGRRPLPANVPIAGGHPVKPKWLRGIAARLWDRYEPLLTWLAEADTETLAAWCALAAEFQKDTRSMTAARIGQMRTLAAELGMTPSARTRLGAIPRAPTKKKSPYFA